MKVHVTVFVHGKVWDTFTVSKDEVVFTNNNYSNNDVSYSRELETTEANVYTSADARIKERNIGNGQNIVEKINKLDISSHLEGDCSILPKKSTELKWTHNLYINGYLLSLFIKTLLQSSVYRRYVIANFKECNKRRGLLLHPSGIVRVNIKLVHPRKNIIDFAWNERVERLAIERRELDNAMSWLSTLGGAFSALGEEFKHCAEIAGRISVQQFTIAMRLGDPNTVARCKLYLALSLVQRGYFKHARQIIEQQFTLARSAPVVDNRLVSMCLGIWAKLKYDLHKRRILRRGKKLHCYINLGFEHRPELEIQGCPTSE
ncbi:hypothetical protein ANN_00359 [Periplaneta americana]|uniref:Uncharacterized protein n=1 Tax=Periplaneta americana TaxID=6978 RepID=A0ABQ8TTD7_PERAM|nr:hypothetical protein ANN_00359 [Periplaneta americana]